MTGPQHTVLAHLSDSEARLGADLTENANTLRNLQKAGYIRNIQDSGPLLVCMWEITPKGLAALEASA